MHLAGSWGAVLGRDLKGVAPYAIVIVLVAPARSRLAMSLDEGSDSADPTSP